MKRELTGHYKLPELKEGQSYYCKGIGCGHCGIKTVDEWSYRETRNEVVMIEQYHTAEVSDCCGGEVGIWDDASEVDVEFDHLFEEKQQ